MGFACAAPDLRLATAERACARRVHDEEDGGDWTHHGSGAGVARTLGPGRAGRSPRGRNAHGKRSEDLRGQSLRAELGCPEPVRHRELHIPNHERVQSDPHDPGARLYERRRDREPLQEEFGITPVVLARSSEGDRKTAALLHWHLGPALAGPSISGGAGRFFGGVTLEMYNEFPHQAPVTERPVAL